MCCMRALSGTRTEHGYGDGHVHRARGSCTCTGQMEPGRAGKVVTFTPARPGETSITSFHQPTDNRPEGSREERREKKRERKALLQNDLQHLHDPVREPLLAEHDRQVRLPGDLLEHLELTHA